MTVEVKPPENYRSLLGCATEPLQGEELRDAMMLIVHERKQHREYGLVEMLKAERGGAILVSRLKYHNVDVSPFAMAFMLTLCESPGKIVQWAHTCACLQATTKTQVTLVDLLNTFGFAVPKETEYRRLWDMQKRPRASMGESDNWLDVPSFWPELPILAG